jgi:hypothetical protein
MNKVISVLFLLILLSVQASAQFRDFPTGIDGTPEAKLKGAVHTILTIEQRGEKVFSTVVEVYDLNGRLIESLSSNAGIEIHSGNMVRLGGKTLYIYDASGRLIKEKTFTPEGQYTGHETYIYDSKNFLIGTRIYDANDKETGVRTYSYFPEKREVVATWNFYYEGRIPPPMKNLLSYDEKGQWTKRAEFDSNGNPNDFVTFEYDAQDNFVKEVHCCKYNFTHRYSYKFDKQGNWIERQNTYVQLGDNGKDEADPNWMYTYRVITYYTDNETKP